MLERLTSFRRVGLVGKTQQAGLPAVLDRLLAVFSAHGVEVVFQEMLQPGDPLRPGGGGYAR